MARAATSNRPARSGAALLQTGRTADVGSGSGREVAWLAANGFDAVGYEPSRGLREEAQRRYPALAFAAAALPELAGIADASFDNVLCETVLMHLDAAEIEPAVTRLLSIVKPGGTLYLSWRVTEGTDQRDPQGRLYAAFQPEPVRRALMNAIILLDELASAHRPAKGSIASWRANQSRDTPNGYQLGRSCRDRHWWQQGHRARHCAAVRAVGGRCCHRGARGATRLRKRKSTSAKREASASSPSWRTLPTRPISSAPMTKRCTGSAGSISSSTMPARHALVRWKA